MRRRPPGTGRGRTKRDSSCSKDPCPSAVPAGRPRPSSPGSLSGPGRRAFPPKTDLAGDDIFRVSLGPDQGADDRHLLSGVKVLPEEPGRAGLDPVQLAGARLFQGEDDERGLILVTDFEQDFPDRPFDADLGVDIVIGLGLSGQGRKGEEGRAAAKSRALISCRRTRGPTGSRPRRRAPSR